MDIFAILILFFSVILSSLVIAYLKLSDKTISMMLYFSGAFLLALAFTKVIPDIFAGENIFNLGYFVLLGFFIQIFIEYFSGGIDHGHHHEEMVHHHDESKHEHHDHKLIKTNPLGLLIGISVHAFFEGMPFSGHFHTHNDVETMLLLGIVIHKIPIAIVIMSLFLGAGFSRKKSFIYLSLFALAAPLGSIASYFGGNMMGNIDQYYKIIMAVVVGIFFHIATVILYEGDKGHKFNIFKFITIIIGIATAVIISHNH